MTQIEEAFLFENGERLYTVAEPSRGAISITTGDNDLEYTVVLATADEVFNLAHHLLRVYEQARMEEHKGSGET